VGLEIVRRQADRFFQRVGRLVGIAGSAGTAGQLEPEVGPPRLGPEQGLEVLAGLPQLAQRQRQFVGLAPHVVPPRLPRQHLPRNLQGAPARMRRPGLVRQQHGVPGPHLLVGGREEEVALQGRQRLGGAPLLLGAVGQGEPPARVPAHLPAVGQVGGHGEQGEGDAGARQKSSVEPVVGHRTGPRPNRNAAGRGGR
jgi:hypothetical protein